MSLFPPAYLLSFVTDHVRRTARPTRRTSAVFPQPHGRHSRPVFSRRRLSDSDAAGIQREIATYKAARVTQSDGSAALLSTQASFSDGPAWDVLQETAADGAVLLYAFENGGPGSNSTNVVPKDLNAGTTYIVRSADVGELGEATGADLMANGISVVQSPTSASHLLMLVPESGRTPYLHIQLPPRLRVAAAGHGSRSGWGYASGESGDAGSPSSARERACRQ